MSDRLEIAREDIEKIFSEGPVVLTEAAVRETLKRHRVYWRLSARETYHLFVSFMLEKTPLRRVHIELPRRTINGYTWGKQPFMETLLKLVSGSYFSHYTAMRLHGLTEQVPKTLYLSREKLRLDTRTDRQSGVTQADLDANFSKPARLSGNQADVLEEGVRLMLLEAIDHHGEGITDGRVNLGGRRPLQLRYTSLERTMIDCVIRPPYAGGVFEIAKAFEHARGRLSVNRMNSLYRKMQLYYPYHQAIGYYLERSGYRPSAIDLFRAWPMEHDFYLANDMRETDYIERWRLYVPKGF